MRGRVTFWVSLGLNVLLLGLLVRALYWVERAAQPVPLGPRPATDSVTESLVKTNVVVRRQNFTWDEIESRDYRTYIENLRSVGCPEPTIRDIIIADVNHLYAERKLSEVVTADQQWWRSEPDTNLLYAAFAKQNALEQERRTLLTQLLGPGWERSANPSLATFAGVNLSGGGFASLTAEARRSVQAIHEQSTARLRDYALKQQQAGLAPDPAELARFQREARQELAKLLTGDQMEEYLLRYSPLAHSMRSELRGYDVTADEFRNIFKARDAYDQQLQLLAGAHDPATEKRRQELERQRELAVEKAFPQDKLALYKLNQDPLFQQAQAAAVQSGAPADAVLPLYEIQQLARQEIQRIRNNTSLAPEEMERALLEVDAAQRKSMRQLLGDQAYEKLLQTGRR